MGNCSDYHNYKSQAELSREFDSRFDPAKVLEEKPWRDMGIPDVIDLEAVANRLTGIVLNRALEMGLEPQKIVPNLVQEFYKHQHEFSPCEVNRVRYIIAIATHMISGYLEQSRQEMAIERILNSL